MIHSNDSSRMKTKSAPTIASENKPRPSSTAIPMCSMTIDATMKIRVRQ